MVAICDVVVGMTVVVFSVLVDSILVVGPNVVDSMLVVGLYVVALVFTNVSFCIPIDVVGIDVVVVTLYADVLFTVLVVLLKGVVVYTNVGLVVRFSDWLLVVVWIIIRVVVCAVSVVVDRFNRGFDCVVSEACVDVGGRCVVVDGSGLIVVVVVDCCVDVCIGENVDVEKIMLFVVLTTGDIDVVPMVPPFVVVCSSGELQIYNVGSITVHDML